MNALKIVFLRYFIRRKMGKFCAGQSKIWTLAGPTDFLPARAGMPAHFANSVIASLIEPLIAF